MQTDQKLSSNEPQTELEIQKSLELKKLTLEIAELERPWWKRPAYILAALPTLLAMIALSVGFINGYFSAQLTKLENQRHDIEAQVKEFESRRDVLNSELAQVKLRLEDSERRKKETDAKIQLAIRELLSSEPRCKELAELAK